MQARFDGCDILLELSNRRTAVYPCSGLKLHRKPPAMHPQVSDRLAFLLSYV